MSYVFKKEESKKETLSSWNVNSSAKRNIITSVRQQNYVRPWS